MKLKAIIKRRFAKVFFAIAAILLFAIGAKADIGASLFTANYDYTYFRNVTTQKGSSVVRTICQDAKGMVWFGSEHGLMFYDGYGTHLRMYDKAGEWNTIHCILPFDESHLYIGTGEGLAIYNLPLQQYEETPKIFEPLHEVRALKMHDGELWIGTKENGLFVYNPRNNTLTRETQQGGKAIPFIFSIEAADDKLFIGGYDGLYERNANNGLIKKIALDKERRVMVNSLMWDNDSRLLLVGTEGCLYSYDPASRNVERTPHGSGNSIKSIAKDKRDNLLLATDAGLYVYDNNKHTERFVNHDSRNPFSLANDVVWQIHIDNSQNVWLATGRGVSLVPSQARLKIVSLSELTGLGLGNQISIVRKDADGDYWLGGENGLIHVRKSGKVDWFCVNNISHPLRHNHIRDVFEDSGNVVWIASDGGVARYDRQADRFVYYDIKANRVVANTRWSYDIDEDRHGNLWIASFVGGVFAINRSQLLASNSSFPFISEPLGTDATGGSAYKLATPDGQTIWAMTKNGLVAINTKTKKAIKTGKPGTDISNYDPLEWLAENGGLFRRRDRKLEETAYSLMSSGIVGGCLSVYKDNESDCLVIGGNDCITIIPTQEFERKPKSRSVYISSVSANGVDLMPQVDFKFVNNDGQWRIAMNSRSNIQIELSTLDYSSMAVAKFYYRIDNSQWNSLERGQNNLLLTELSGGNHKLQVSIDDPTINEHAIITTYDIRMPYPWYASPLAKIVYALLLIIAAIVVAMSIHRKSVAKYERREREKSLELSKMKIDFFENISHELKTPLSLIIGSLHEIMVEIKGNSAMMEKLTAIHDNAKILDKLVNQILGIKNVEGDNSATDDKLTKPTARRLTEADEAFLGKVVAAIENNMASDGFGVQELAATVGVDQKQLYRKVKQLTDMTPVNYIRKLKMRRAASLLDQHRFSVSEVMYMVGFTSSSYFSKCFAEEYGITPKNYSNKEKKQ